MRRSRERHTRRREGFKKATERGRKRRREGEVGTNVFVYVCVCVVLLVHGINRFRLDHRVEKSISSKLAKEIFKKAKERRMSR